MKRMMCMFGILLLALAPAHAQESPAPEAPPAVETAAEATPAEAAPADATPVEAAPAEATADTETTEVAAEDDRFVVICPIEGEIDPGMAVVVKRAVKEAENAEALLFVINTPGGRVDSAIEITTAIMSVECPTIAFIEGMGAISAGAIISYACDAMYMAEGSNIGASTPIMPGVETTEAMDEKSNSFVRGKYRALGEANGHEPLLGEAMVDRDIEVRAYKNEDGTYAFFRVGEDDRSTTRKSDDLLDKILDAVSEDAEGNEEITDLLRKILGAAADESPESAPQRTEDDEARAFLDQHTVMVSPRGELLTMTSQEAVNFGLAESITSDVDDTLREYLLGSVNRMTITPNWEEALFAFLTSPTIAGLLLAAGLGGIYLEVRTPGFGAPGIIGATCLALFFGSHMVLGMASWIDVALILCGFLLILAEVFLLPGFGVAGILGVACLIGGSYLALVKAPLPEFTWEVQHLHSAFYTLAVTMFSLVGFVIASGLLIPFTPLGNVLILRSVQDAGEGFVAQDLAKAQSAIGLVGTATTPLRPAGKGRFGSERFDVVTRGEFIDQGTPILIIESSGNRYVVTAAEPEETA